MAEVKIIKNGRVGKIQYLESGKVCEFDWEFGGGDVLVTIWFPAEEQWNTLYPWARGRRKEIVTTVAEEARKKEAPHSRIKWENDRFHLMKEQIPNPPASSGASLVYPAQGVAQKTSQSVVSGVTLECANADPIQGATESDIISLFADDNTRGDFIVLSRSAQYYIQAAGDGNGPYILECRSGDAEHHFRSVESLSKQVVQNIFLKYLRKDEAFASACKWEKVNL